jgi:DNA polymerase-3 subunit delta'
MAPPTAPPKSDAGIERLERALPEIHLQPHARAVLGAALGDGAAASHAYLFHGPSGSGKRAVARAFATELLREGARSADTVEERVLREAHPDLTWVRASGASEMLVGDIEEPVVAAATRTPFESARRVFVLEGAEAMNDQAANRLLKTLEEPPEFVHLLLLTERREDVLPTIASRCQLIRFDPTPSSRIAADLLAEGVEELRARACARLSLGDAGLARRLASEDGEGLRRAAEGYVRAAFAGRVSTRPWAGLLESARSAGEAEGERLAARVAEELELIPRKERKRHEREALEARRRAERRVRVGTLDLALRLSELWLRDVLCLREGAGEVIFACDRAAEIADDAADREPRVLREALDRLTNSRLSLALNVGEELALEALAYRLEALLAVGAPASGL